MSISLAIPTIIIAKADIIIVKADIIIVKADIIIITAKEAITTAKEVTIMTITAREDIIIIVNVRILPLMHHQLQLKVA